MKRPILTINLAVLGISVTALSLLEPAHLHAAAGPRPMSICGNLVGANGFEWGELTEGFQMAVALDERSLRVVGWIQNGTAEPRPYNATLLTFGGYIHPEVLGADGVWRRVEEKLPEQWRIFRGYIGALSPSEDNTVEPGAIMPDSEWHRRSLNSKLYGKEANLVTFTDTNKGGFIWFTNPTPQGLFSPSNPRQKDLSGSPNQPQRNWTSTVTVSCALRWRDWPAWVFDQPRVKIRITQSLYNRSNLSRSSQPCYEFKITSPPIEVDNDLIRRAVAERENFIPKPMPSLPSGLLLPGPR